MLPFQKKTENTAQAIFFNLFNVCSSWKWKFVVCPFADEETNGSYPFSNGLNGFAHLWSPAISHTLSRADFLGIIS